MCANSAQREGCIRFLPCRHCRDAQESQGKRIVIDDGRRFLSRTRKKFDAIAIDPPPPIEAAGSSLLYSSEFYELAKLRLNPHGILQAWIPHGVPPPTVQAILRSLSEAFPYVRSFGSIESWGTHLLASMEPILRSPQELAERLPAGALRDLMEWAAIRSTNIFCSARWVFADSSPRKRNPREPS
jgi:spermidine synthase